MVFILEGHGDLPEPLGGVFQCDQRLIIGGLCLPRLAQAVDAPQSVGDEQVPLKEGMGSHATPCRERSSYRMTVLPFDQLSTAQRWAKLTRSDALLI